MRAFLIVLFCGWAAAYAEAASSSQPLQEVIESELTRTFIALRMVGDSRLYFMSYAIEDKTREGFSYSRGSLFRDTVRHKKRLGDVEVRIGSAALDNTHPLRDKQGSPRQAQRRPFSLPIDDDPTVIRSVFRVAADKAFKEATGRLAEVEANVSLKVAEMDTSGDFSRETPAVFSQSSVSFHPDLKRLRALARSISRLFSPHPWIYESSVDVDIDETAKNYVNTEGTRLFLRNGTVLMRVSASSTAEDGMKLELRKMYVVRDGDDLPGDDVIRGEAADLIARLADLRAAPVVEPYTGPAVISGRAAAVFFHEIVGHRLEGHRQRMNDEGQTFSGKVGGRILPDALTLMDDPGMTHWNGEPLSGRYAYDDEGVPAQRVTLVDRGVLKNFLMCRKPVFGFPYSNGHGRAQMGLFPVGRQGNLMVSGSQTVPAGHLLELLVEECQRQGKPYGYVILEIQGGFTFTGRNALQAYKIIPRQVLRVYADGRPSVWVRGADMVGTPLASLDQIAAVGDDSAVFNGICGAESGFLPVSAVAPSFLLRRIEIQRAWHDQEPPPILPAPEGE